MTVTLITGAGSGIGREFARRLAADGMAIAAIDCQPEGLSQLEAELQGQNRQVACEVADVTDGPLLLEIVAALEQRLGPIDLMIASAGVGRETSGLDLRMDDLQAVIGVNLLGVANSIAAVLPGMIKRRRGHIVAISSMASYRGVPRMLAYCASKSGVNAFMDGLRIEVRPYNIFTTTLCPGWIRTPMTAHINGPMPGLMDVDYAVGRMLHAIRRRKAFYAFPASLAWRLRVLRWLPRSTADWLIARMLGRMKISRQG
ncbi:MAG: SDR family NAD(P)-dependent oxidoreductase [Planctomycetes bacterium]|nr:SDR family NAD(P)-dependent oxidoreductase [Planctomycetota bacterium]